MSALPSRDDLLAGLSAQGSEQDALFARADRLRKERKGDVVPIRGIIEFSNYCSRDCAYCGIRSSNAEVRRYTIPDDEILAAARTLWAQGQRTLVLQSGELSHAPELDRRLGELVRRIKAETPLAVTLSVGERPPEVYAYWRDCGMDRYLLRFETSDPELYARLHGGASLAGRLDCLRALKRLGVHAGGGFQIGLPGETHGITADNILLCRELELDMIGVGPFIPAPRTPLAGAHNAYADDPDLFFRVFALLRLANPDANIPATTALDALFPGEGRLRALQCGANVYMPNSTPPPYRESYQLYPNKPGLHAQPAAHAADALEHIRALGRRFEHDP